MSTSSEKEKPRGRSLRSKLSDEFVQALAADFEVHGQAALEQVRAENPAAYIRLAADLVPREQNIVVSDNQYADCQSTSELAERVLTESGAETVTPRMRERALAELSRHAEALAAIATGRKPERQDNGPMGVNEKARAAAAERRKLLRRGAPASWSMPTD